MSDQTFRLDRSHFEILSFEQADQKINDHSEMSRQERFALYHYLNSIAYGYAGLTPPAMDKTVFSCRKLSDGEYLLP